MSSMSTKSSTVPTTEDPCVPSPCQNGGRCVRLGKDFFCECPNKFEGLMCEFDDPCLSSPCVNGGRCIRLGRNYVCECPKSFQGLRCELAILCDSFPCQNGGTCQSFSSYYRCFCPTGYLGFTCGLPAESLDFRTPAPTIPANKLSDSWTTWLLPATPGFCGLVVLFCICCIITVCKRKRRQDQRLCFGCPDRIPRSVRENIDSGTRDTTVTSLSESVSYHPTSEHPQTSTCVTEQISPSDCASNHLSPEQPHLHDNRESRLDGGSVNDGYDHVSDLPPTYMSVVTDPTYIRDEASSLPLPPSYDDVVAAIRPTSAPNDGPVTSAGVTS